MPTVFPLVSDSKQQYFDANGVLATGYQLFVYTAGSSSKATSYTDSGGLSANTNPIILNSRGETPSGIYVESGSYKMTLATDTDTDPPASAIWTRDNLTAINDAGASSTSQWVASGITPTYLSATTFSLPGDQRTEFHVGRRLRSENTGGTVYSTITDSQFSSVTTVTVENDSPDTLDSGLSSVSYGLLTATDQSISESAIAGGISIATVTGAAMWELVEAISTTGANRDFENGFDAGYDHEFVFSGVYPSSADKLGWRSRESGSYVTASSTYRYMYRETVQGTTTQAGTAIDYCAISANNNQSAAAGQAMHGKIYFADPANASFAVRGLSSVGYGLSSGATGLVITDVHGERVSAAACQGIRFFWYAGSNNFGGGTITHYRRKNV